MPPRPAPPRHTRQSLLTLLERGANSAHDDFFRPTRHAESLQWQFDGIRVEVRKRTFSFAHPTNVTYEIHLGSPWSDGYLVAAVLHPVANFEANREAYKSCLKELAGDPALEMSQYSAQ